MYTLILKERVGTKLVSMPASEALGMSVLECLTKTNKIIVACLKEDGEIKLICSNNLDEVERFKEKGHFSISANDLALLMGTKQFPNVFVECFDNATYGVVEVQKQTKDTKQWW